MLKYSYLLFMLFITFNLKWREKKHVNFSFKYKVILLHPNKYILFTASYCLHMVTLLSYLVIRQQNAKLENNVKFKRPELGSVYLRENIICFITFQNLRVKIQIWKVMKRIVFSVLINRTEFRSFKLNIIF